MNKNELVEAIASKTDITKSDVDKVVTSLFEVITDTLSKGQKISLKGFGNFEIRERKGRTGRNPRTGEAITIKDCKVASFKPSINVKNAINK